MNKKIQEFTDKLWCAGCEKYKPDVDFCGDKLRAARRGRCYRCKACHRKRAREWQDNNRERFRESARVRARKYRLENPEKAKASQRKTHYKIRGFSVEEYEQMYKAQNGRCKICTKPKKKYERKAGLYADHNHKTGVFRALLCSRCNMLVGVFEKSNGVFKQIERYLNEHGSSLYQ